MADISATLRAWSITAASNQPQGGTTIGGGLDDNLRAIQQVVRQFLASQGTSMSSAATLDLATADGYYIHVTGTTTTTAMGTEPAGVSYWLESEGAWPITHNATSLILIGGASINCAAGDILRFTSEGSGNWRQTAWFKSSGAPATMSQITNSLSGDVALNNISNYFTGPTVAQGTAGTWFASGTVTLQDTAGGGRFEAKLWDGTTVIAAGKATSVAQNEYTTISLSGFISSPAGNIRISVKDPTSTSGVIIFNVTGTSKDSTITAIRIG